MSKQTKKIIKIVAGLLVLGVAVYFGKMAIDEYNRQIEAQGIVVCQDEDCIKTMHIHADIEFDLCGEKLALPREIGPLTGLHTHKERNYLHFHDEVDLDYQTREQEFDQRLSIQEVIEIFGVDPDEHCGTDDVSIRAQVKHSENFKDYDEQWTPVDLDYNWQDGDLIQLIYELK